MSLPEPSKDKALQTDIMHLEGGNVDSDPTLQKNAYEGEESPSSRHKTGLERKLVWKMDLLLIPLISLIYFSAYLDRNSLGNARILGLQKAVGMTNQGYYNCAQMFFVGYTLFMLPGNILLRWLPPNIQLGGSVAIFGALLCAMSAAKDYPTVLVLRIFIGCAQAFVQGVGLYASLWYKRDEVATRGSLYFGASTLAGAFSGLIAYGVQKNLTLTATGKLPWRWLFLIEGLISVAVGILIYLLLPQFPDKMKSGKNWLFTKDEINLAIRRSASWNTRGSKLDWRQILTSLKDPKSWAFAFMNGGIALGLSSIGVFLPTFIVDFGYTAATAQLFSVIPYACAFVCLPLTAFFSDRINLKGPIIIAALGLSCIGYIILLTVSSVAVKMVGTCFIASGLYTSVVLTVTWLAINTGGFTKRGTTWALAEVVGQCFSIMGSNVYKDKPRYIKGHSIVLAFLLFAILNAVGLIVWMNVLNKRRDRILAEFAGRDEIHPHMSRSLEQEFDHHINFRYIL